MPASPSRARIGGTSAGSATSTRATGSPASVRRSVGRKRPPPRHRWRAGLTERGGAANVTLDIRIARVRACTARSWRWRMQRIAPYRARRFELSGLTGISDRTLEVHFKLYEGYVKETNL